MTSLAYSLHRPDSAASSSTSFHPHHHKNSHAHTQSSLRRDSSGSTSSNSDSDEATSTTKGLTSPDLSSLTPSASVPSYSPTRAPGLSPSSTPLGSLSAPSSPSLLAGDFAFSPTSSSNSLTAPNSPIEDDDEADDAPVTPLPGRLPRPKTKLDRERERAAGLTPSGGVKREGLGVKLARKRADSFKWAKYANVGTFEVELGLSNDELRRA